jgi:hypothetical protein
VPNRIGKNSNAHFTENMICPPVVTTLPIYTPVCTFDTSSIYHIFFQNFGVNFYFILSSSTTMSRPFDRI